MSRSHLIDAAKRSFLIGALREYLFGGFAMLNKPPVRAYQRNGAFS
jgi:hypothetical protein